MLSTPRIIILDYGLGNLHSVKNACELLGVSPEISNRSQDIVGADGIILPGVGSFGVAVENLEKLGLTTAILNHVAIGKPLMGICLGMQLLLDASEEFGNHSGLGLVKGNIVSFKGQGKGGIIVPHVGWNSIQKTGLCGSPFDSIPDLSSFYFVHSYFCRVNEDIVATYTTYSGVKFCSSFIKENIVGVQFHPEKSSIQGLELYKKWLKTI